MVFVSNTWLLIVKGLLSGAVSAKKKALFKVFQPQMFPRVKTLGA
jgi:hypothetical protein